MFEYRLDLLGADEKIVLSKLLGQPVTVRLALPEGNARYFHGFVTRFALVGREEGYASYQATVRPWLWFLTRIADCRIFQNLTVPEIVKEVFKGRKFTDFDEALGRKYRSRDYCVQYRETDFNFVSRLLEEEGIYYFFRHSDGKHELILADAPGSHEPIPGGPRVPFYPPGGSVVREEDHVRDWDLSQEVQPAAYVLTDFDFQKPRADMFVNTRQEREHARAGELEVYDYPGEYIEPADGEQYVKTRLEELQAGFELVRGEGPVRGMTAGGLFKLVGHPRDDQNREYLATKVRHELANPEFLSGGTATDPTYACSFTAIDSKQPFRPARLTPRPVVQGPQTAIVVGKSGEEIWTDKFGRVKVKFHWDRLGHGDENSSCWVRVVSVWAGKAWGGIQIPRIGQEVIVDFLEGDPDQPIVTGRVYNADQMPPYGLPANQTQSGIKSRSSKGGSPDNFNEIRFEDKKGSEELYLHAEKNHTNITENDRSEDVGHDRSLHVGHDKSEAIDNNKSITVGVDHVENIGANKTMTVGANHDETIAANKTLAVGGSHGETIGANMTITIAQLLTETVGINYAETVGAAMELTIGAVFTETVGAAKVQTIGLSKEETIGTSKSVSVGSNSAEEVGGAKSVSVAKDLTEAVSGAHAETVTKEFTLRAKKVSITAEDEVLIKTGSASITLKKNGDITIDGKNINVKGSGNITMKARKILEN